MKISSSGLKQIIELGMLNPTKTVGVSRLYTWKDVTYFCGPKGSFDASNLNGVFIELSADQLALIDMQKKPSKLINEKPLDLILDKFETAAVFKFDSKDDFFKVFESKGVFKSIELIRIETSSRSPFTIIKNSLKPFHGKYSPHDPLSSKFESLGIDPSNLWMTGVPIIKNNKFLGALVGFSNENDYGVDVVELFNQTSKNISFAA